FSISDIKEASVDLLKRGECGMHSGLNTRQRGYFSFSCKGSSRKRRGSHTHCCIAQETPAAASRSIICIGFHICIIVSCLQSFVSVISFVIIVLTHPTARTPLGVAKQNPNYFPGPLIHLTPGLRFVWGDRIRQVVKAGSQVDLFVSVVHV